MAYTEFYDYDLKALTPDIESCSIKVPAKNAETTPETDTPAVNDTPDTDTPDTDTPDTEEKPAEDKKPTGDWEIDEEKGEITHTKEDGTKEEYKGEISYDKDDKPTKIELTDKDGKPAGSLTVTEKEDGSIKVEEQELIENKEETERPIDDGGEEIAIIPWAWILPAAAILLIGGVVIILIIVKKHKKEEE